MVWTNLTSSFSENFKKRIGCFVINRYLKELLDYKISMDDLTIDEDITINAVPLSLKAINSIIEGTDMPMEFVDGFIESMSVKIPWATLLNESCVFNIDGLTVTLQVKKRANPAQISASIFHSMCESFSTMNMAEDCLKQEDVESSPSVGRRNQSDEEPIAGVEMIAKAIDSIIMRVQVKLTNTVVRLEYVSEMEERGLAMELHVGKIVYCGKGQAITEQPGSDFSSSTTSRICIEDINLYTDDYTIDKKAASVFSRSSSAEDGNTSQNLDVDSDPPLRLVSLSGEQDFFFKFTDINQYGLPCTIDEIDFNLTTLKIHCFPHQVHILSSIVSSMTVPAKPQSSPTLMPLKQKPITEGMLQETLRFSLMDPGLNAGWGGDMDSSRDFKPIPRVHSRTMKALPDLSGESAESAGGSPPTPKIKIKLKGVIGVFKEKDPGICKMGGEANRAIALTVMREAATNFFRSDIQLPSLDNKKVRQFHADLSTSVPDSHVQLLAAPIVITHQEGTAIGPGNTQSYAAITKLSIGKLSLMESVIECDAEKSQKPELIALLQFQSTQNTMSILKDPDLTLVYKDMIGTDDSSPTSSVKLTLRNCSLDIDPGFVDRTYFLLNYSEMNPQCLKPEPAPENPSNSNLEVEIYSGGVNIAFHIPKPDMRDPSEVGPDFIRHYWTRKIHPEIYAIEMEQFTLRIEQASGSLSPLEIIMSCSLLEASYKEDLESTTLFPLIQARRLPSSESLKKQKAMELRIKVCMDDSLRLQGKFNASSHRMQKSVFEKKPTNSSSSEDGEIDTDQYFVVDPDASMGKPGSKPSQAPKNANANSFLKQTEDILAALEQAVMRNNLLIDIKFDAISLVIPSKRLYEIIYNRIGNDLLLWLPTYLTVKEHILGEAVMDPLADDSKDFSDVFSGRNPPPLALKDNSQQGPKFADSIMNTNVFPKDRKSAESFQIHTDTAVRLEVKQAQVLVCIPMDSMSPLGLLHVSAVDLGLNSASGLERSPEISIFNLRAREGSVKYGLCNKNALPSQLHFNSDLVDSLDVLFTSNSYCNRAWPNKASSGDLLNLTAKILFDSAENLKSIQLAFNVFQGGICVRDPMSSPEWINSLVSFFTVVEFPVLGYVPPVVLTELHFLLNQCAVELSPPAAGPARAALCIGKLIVSCSLLDTTQDASVTLGLEDISLFLTKDAEHPVESAICVADIDYLDIDIALSEPDVVAVPDTPAADTGKQRDEKKENDIDSKLSVTANCNLLRLRTCADTLQLMVGIFSSFETDTRDTSSGAAGCGSQETIMAGMEPALSSNSCGSLADEASILPDLEDAMADIHEEAKAELREPAGRDRPPQQGGTGAQMFFFPDETTADLTRDPGSSDMPNIICAKNDPMTQSMYEERQDSTESDTDLESFCILEEEEGSGIVGISGEPAVRVLENEEFVLVDSHFTVPSEAIDYLKAPKGFPVSVSKLAITKLSIIWQIFGGNDFSDSSEMKSNTKEKLQEMGMSMVPNKQAKSNPNKFSEGGFGSPAGQQDSPSYLQTSPGSGQQSGSRPSSTRLAADQLKIQGGPGRNSKLLLEVIVNKMAAQHETYPIQQFLPGEVRPVAAEPGEKPLPQQGPVSRQVLIIPQLEIRDRLVDSEINKLMHSHSCKARPKQSSAHMLNLKVLTVRPDPDSHLEETNVKVSMQPIRINIDQDTLFFIIDFFNSLAPTESNDSLVGNNSSDSSSSGSMTPVKRDRSGSMKFSSGLQAIRLEVPEGTEVFEDARSSPPKEKMEESIEGEDDVDGIYRSKSSTPGPAGPSKSNIYIKSFRFSPSVPIRIDYVGKYVDLTQGALTGLLVGLAQLNCSEITLRQLEFKQGILGIDKLLALIATTWLADIRSTQLPAVLGGVGPMHALIQMMTGIRDLILMPIEQYRKDGRIVRGLQKGTNSFTHSTTLSILDVTNKLLNMIKFGAELAFDVMSPEGCVVQGKLPHPTQYCRRRVGRSGLRRARGTPHDVREGMLGAMALVREGLDETARSLALAAGRERGGGVGGVLRAVPSTMVRPVILGAAATSNLLDGVKNQISPDQRAEEEEKWKTHLQ